MISYIIAFNDAEIRRPDIRDKGYDIVRVPAIKVDIKDNEQLRGHDFMRIFGRAPYMTKFEMGLYRSWVDALTHAVSMKHNEPFLIGESDLYTRSSAQELEELLYASQVSILRPWLTSEVTRNDICTDTCDTCTAFATQVMKYVMSAYAGYINSSTALDRIYGAFAYRPDPITCPMEDILWGTHGLVFRSSDAAKQLLEYMLSVVLPSDILLVYACVLHGLPMAITNKNLFVQVPRDRTQDVYDRYV